jgi:hypothetical protein
MKLTNEQVINAFMNCQPANGGALVSDGQSLFSYNLRIAEHIRRNGSASTLVYDYSRGGDAFKSHTTSQHVGMVKRRVPRVNVVRVHEAKRVGLIT